MAIAGCENFPLADPSCPDSEEGTTKGTKEHEMRSPKGFHGFYNMAEQTRSLIPSLS
jgi:hypothetical protein